MIYRFNLQKTIKSYYKYTGEKDIVFMNACRSRVVESLDHRATSCLSTSYRSYNLTYVPVYVNCFIDKSQLQYRDFWAHVCTLQIGCLIRSDRRKSAVWTAGRIGGIRIPRTCNGMVKVLNP